MICLEDNKLGTDQIFPQEGFTNSSILAVFTFKIERHGLFQGRDGLINAVAETGDIDIQALRDIVLTLSINHVLYILHLNCLFVDLLTGAVRWVR